MLHHVSLEVAAEQLDRTVEFWSLLGFQPTAPPEPIAPFVTWLQRGGTQIHLLKTEDPTAPPLGHAAVVVEDFDAKVGQLRVAGFEVTDARELWEAPRAFALAPGGHRVELMAEPPS